MRYDIKATLFIFAFALLLAQGAQARPVSYPGGWTLMIKNDTTVNSAHIHYSPSAKYSIGLRSEYLRDTNAKVNALHLNILAKRWNAPASQANFYIKSGIGLAYDSGESQPVAYSGIALDWEDRRYFTSYENRFFHGGDIERFAQHKARVGIAPYIGDYGDFHTWLMLQADYQPAADRDNKLRLTPMVRLFKGSTMLETGINLKGGMMLNFIQRF